MTIVLAAVGELSKEKVQSILETATDTMRVGSFDPKKLLEFVASFQDEEEIIITATRRDDDYINAGCLIAETMYKKYIGVAGLRDD